MSKAARIVEKMKNNPRDWRIDDLKTVATQYGLTWRQPGTSHVTFTLPTGGGSLSVPAHKPIKPVYVRLFLQLLEKSDG